MSVDDVIDDYLIACAEVDYRLEVLRNLIDQLPEGNTQC